MSPVSLLLCKPEVVIATIASRSRWNEAKGTFYNSMVSCEELINSVELLCWFITRISWELKFGCLEWEHLSTSLCTFSMIFLTDANWPSRSPLLLDPAPTVSNASDSLLIDYSICYNLSATTISIIFIQSWSPPNTCSNCSICSCWLPL